MRAVVVAEELDVFKALRGVWASIPGVNQICTNELIARVIAQNHWALISQRILEYHRFLPPGVMEPIRIVCRALVAIVKKVGGKLFDALWFTLFILYIFERL